jgi:tetratricopeptide (TPR) repeat protein
MSPLSTALRHTVQISRWAVSVDPAEGWTDVWSRAGRKYRTRAAVLLAVDMVLFLGLCMFTYWLRTGSLPFHSQEYFSLLFRSFKVNGSDTVSLTDMLLWPISVERTPLQVVILALVMAALVCVPVLVSILYRFPSALPFAAMIAFVAVMPWLGITGIAACMLASLRPFRMGFRFGSAMLGLVPFALYLYLATRSTGEPPPGATPLEQFKLFTPWVLSLMLACFNLAVVLSIASIVGYRPGAIAPVLAVLFAVPVVLFEAKIGQNELYYSVVEANFGPSSPSCFKSESLPQFIQQRPEAEQLYASRIYLPSHESLEDVQRQWRLGGGNIAQLRQKVESLALADTEQDRAETVLHTERFISDFPDSGRVPAALYLQGRAIDTQLDLARLRSDGAIRFYDDFPSTVSGETWRSLAHSYPNHPLAAVAMYKLAIQASRQGKHDEAMEDLSRVLTLTEKVLVEQRRTRPASPSEGWFSLLMPSPPEVESLGVELEDVALEARKLLELIRANGHDPRYGSVPLALLMRMDAHSPLYRDNLAWLDSHFPDSVLHDNLHLLAVLTSESVSVRIEELTQHLADYAGQDSISQATYELGRLLEADTRFEDAMNRYESLRNRFGDSVWTELAMQRLAAMKP